MSTSADFNTWLREFLIAAYENGIDVEGGWECRNGYDHPDWDVVITEMVKPEEN